MNGLAEEWEGPLDLRGGMRRAAGGERVTKRISKRGSHFNPWLFIPSFIKPGEGVVHWDDPEGWYGEGGGRRSGWGTRVHLWRIHVDVWQNQYSIVK